MQYTLYEGEEDTISVCVELTSLPPEGLECAITTHFEPQSLTASKRDPLLTPFNYTCTNKFNHCMVQATPVKDFVLALRGVLSIFLHIHAVQIEDYEDFSLYIEIPATTPLNTEVCMANVSVPIVDDVILEDVQSLSLSMTSATINGYDINVGSQSSVELQIVDNDSKETTGP